jgi:hypothetical protein
MDTLRRLHTGLDSEEHRVFMALLTAAFNKACSTPETPKLGHWMRPGLTG